MKHIDPIELATLVTEVLENSPAAKDFSSAGVTLGELDDEHDFIRVLVHLRNLDKLSEEEADSITAIIERVVSEHDDRFPSVRFADP